MATDASNQPSFSRNRKWSIGINIILAIASVLAICVMVNFFSSRYFKRFYVSSRTRIELSPRTISLLRSLTNQVAVTIYYDKDESLYSNIADLLKEYHFHNAKVAVTTVDYYRDPGAAQEVKLKYNLGASTNRDFVIFDCGGHIKIVNGSLLASYEYQETGQSSEGKPLYDRNLVSFNGELLFTSALYSVSNPKPLKAYFLQGDGERTFDDAEDPESYYQFAEILRRNYIEPLVLNGLMGTNTVPADCNLLIIAGPHNAIPEEELEKIGQFLDRGGRLLALFNTYSATASVGLERLLAKWGVDVSHRIIKDDAEHSKGDYDVIVGDLTPHPVTRPLLRSRLHFLWPRWISRIEPPRNASDVPKVTELARSSPQSVLREDPTATKAAYPMMVAVEKDTARGAERGTTRMLIVGDSFLVGNQMIKSAANEDFADEAVNWLLERTVLLEGLGPQRVTEYHLLITRGQMKAVQWILLGAMPGGVLLFGGLVWFRRRK